MGYSKEEAVKAGAAVQTAQNFNNIGSYSLGYMVSDLSKLARGADPSTIDNADDTPIIEAGYDDGAKNENCESNDGSDEDSVETGGGGEDSSGSSVGGGFSGGFIGSGSCIGKCFIPNGSVDVTDLPPIDGV